MAVGNSFYYIYTQADIFYTCTSSVMSCVSIILAAIPSKESCYKETGLISAHYPPWQTSIHLTLFGECKFMSLITVCGEKTVLFFLVSDCADLS